MIRLLLDALTDRFARWMGAPPAQLAVAGAPRTVPGPAEPSSTWPEVSPVMTADRSEGSPQHVVSEGRHQVGFPEHLGTVNDLEHALARADEAAVRVAELEELLERWLVTHHGHFAPKGHDAALIPATMKALGAGRPSWNQGEWIDVEA